jgi:hypothetical protein
MSSPPGDRVRRGAWDRHKIKRDIDKLARDIVPDLGRQRNVREMIDDGAVR